MRILPNVSLAKNLQSSSYDSMCRIHPFGGCRNTHACHWANSDFGLDWNRRKDSSRTESYGKMGKVFYCNTHKIGWHCFTEQLIQSEPAHTRCRSSFSLLPIHIEIIWCCIVLLYRLLGKSASIIKNNVRIRKTWAKYGDGSAKQVPVAGIKGRTQT